MLEFNHELDSLREKKERNKKGGKKEPKFIYQIYSNANISTQYGFCGICQRQCLYEFNTVF